MVTAVGTAGRQGKASGVTLVAYRCTKCDTVRHERDDATAVWHQCRPLDRHHTALAKIPDVDQEDTQ